LSWSADKTIMAHMLQMPALAQAHVNSLHKHHNSP